MITAALGFDTFLVMRHGARHTAHAAKCEGAARLESIPGTSLGCYFCNDVVAPGDVSRQTLLSFDAFSPFFSLTESPPRDLQISAFK